MRYLVTARPKRERRSDLLDAIDDGSLGRGSVAEGEYVCDMGEARELEDGRVKWVEVSTRLQSSADRYANALSTLRNPSRSNGSVTMARFPSPSLGHSSAGRSR